jgi:hypothetical protein
MSEKTVELMTLVVHVDEDKLLTDFDLAINPGFEELLKGSDRLVVMAAVRALLKAVGEATMRQMGLPTSGGEFHGAVVPEAGRRRH